MRGDEETTISPFHAPETAPHDHVIRSPASHFETVWRKAWQGLLYILALFTLLLAGALYLILA